MRPIEFRAWDEKIKTMIYGVEQLYDCRDVAKGKDGASIGYDLACKGDVIYQSSFGCLLADKDIPVMQYTGILDKNGVKIFEDDVVNVLYNYIGHKTVKYLPTELRYSISNHQASKIEVIGNIHEA